MLRNRLFYAFIALALVIIVALTVREAAATAGIIVEANSARTGTLKCTSLHSRYSLRTEYVSEANMWIIRTEDGPTGVDGGFTNLLSDYRTCSR